MRGRTYDTDMRSPEIAERNAEMKAVYAEGAMSVTRMARYYGVARQRVHEILSDPQSHLPTGSPAKAIVRPLEGLEDGLPHGSESGYRRCRKAYGTACDDCKAAHALEQSRYQARRKAR